MKKLKASNVPSQLTIKKDAGHGWRNSEVEEQQLVDWFEKYLK
jgi:hypothetical protein